MRRRRRHRSWVKATVAFRTSEFSLRLGVITTTITITTTTTTAAAAAIIAKMVQPTLGTALGRLGAATSRNRTGTSLRSSAAAAATAAVPRTRTAARSRLGTESKRSGGSARRRSRKCPRRRGRSRLRVGPQALSASCLAGRAARRARWGHRRRRDGSSGSYSMQT